MWVLGAGLVIILIGLTSLTVGSAVVARHRAQVAADLGALAGAQSVLRDPCGQAAAVVAGNGADLVRCSSDGLNVDVTASVRVRLGRWAVGTAFGAARAGPEQTASGGDGAIGGKVLKHRVQHLDGVGFAQRLVAVAALRRLDAGRAAALAAARGDRGAGGTEPLPGHLERALGEAGPARVAVVNEDGRGLGVRMRCGGQSTDVPPIAGRDQRQQADRRMLGGVQRSRNVDRFDSGSIQSPGRDGPPHRRRTQCARWQVQWASVDQLAGREAFALVAHNLVGHVDGAEEKPDRPRVDIFADRRDRQ